MPNNYAFGLFEQVNNLGRQAYSPYSNHNYLDQIVMVTDHNLGVKNKPLLEQSLGGKMNRCAIQQNAFAACEEMRSSVSMSVSVTDIRETVVCPKPRRLGLVNSTINDPIRPLRWHMSHQQEICDSKAGAELLDIILTKGGYAAEQPCTQVASSPPYFCGSPPSRVSNPLIQDARFGDEKISPVSPRSIPITSGLSSSPSSSARKGGCVRANFGNKPAVRIEGFDCLDRDRRNCSIPALA